MVFNFDGRVSDSPLVESIWRTESETAGSFISAADIHTGIVFSKYQGETTVTLRGPETQATPADFPADAEFFGIVFKLGTFMPHFPPQLLMDRKDVLLPEATSKKFWLHGSAWEIPTFENADTFIDRLIRQGLLTCDPVVSAALQGQQVLSLRSTQYRFLRATGLTQKDIRQIERAQQAVALLQQGVSILDTAHQMGYFDQSHLTKSLKRYFGQTPAQLLVGVATR